MSVAGSWYPNDPVRLREAVDRYLADAAIGELPRPPRALIAPHAGLMYSGPVAGFAYKAIRDVSYDIVVLVGPSHFVPFRGVSLWSEGEWDTPYGPLKVDARLAAAIREESADVVEVAEAHGREHSLEMQLPFVAHLAPRATIVPLVMGHQTRETSFSLGEAIAKSVAVHASTRHREILLIASSDLSHYEDARVASALDQVVLTQVEAIDAEGLMRALEREPRHACGGGPMVSVLHAAKTLGASAARVLRYADSGDVSGDKTAVVGYMAAAIW